MSLEDYISRLDPVLSPFRQLRANYSKEAIGSTNLLFTQNTQFIFASLPLLVLFVFQFISPLVWEVETDAVATLSSAHDNLYIWIRIIMLLMFTYLFTVRMVQIKHTGRLGYWLALGMDRNRYFRFILVVGSLFLSLSVFQVHIFQLLVLRGSFSFLEVLILLLVSFFNTFFVVNLTVTIVDLIENPELGLILINLIILTISIFSGDDFLLRLLFVPELFDQLLDLLLIGGISLAGGGILFFVNTRTFNGIDIELGG